MALTRAVNSKANIKGNTSNDLPVSPKQPVLNKFTSISTFGQTIINLSFSVDTTISEQFLLFVNGQLLTQGSSNDYVFSSINSDSTSSQVTLNSAMVANWNIQAYKLGLKPESEFGVDNRFVQLFEAQNNGFQGFINQSNLLSATSSIGTPSAGLFYSQIANRQSIMDLSQDLKPRMGIDRLPVQQISQIMNEFGPNLERVFASASDTRNQLRFVGEWANNSSSFGTFPFTNSVNAYVEVVFYGTGLNMLIPVEANAKDLRVSIDGGSEGSNLYTVGASGSAVLTGRNYASNSVLPIVAGLTLGVHTAKIRVNAAQNVHCMGIDILNESNLVKTNPGIGYIQGKKLSLGAQSSVAYNSGVTGTRGGRMLVYQAADGTIGRAFQATNAAQQNNAATDHTNEEGRVINYREFGASRGDDFSTLVTSSSSRAYTLDDNVTSLVAQNAVQIISTINGDGFGPNGIGDYMVITFVGTGLDIYNARQSASGADFTIAVDGTNTSLGQIFQPNAITKICSGLPYGTHNVRITRTNNNTNVAIQAFVVYQPKKPTLPQGAIELADYCVLADFAANSTAGQDTVATGVIRKYATREFIYKGTWGVNFGVSNMGGQLVFSSTTGDSLQYTFIGTGFDFRFTQNTAGSTWAMTVDGASNLSGFSTSSYGTGITSFTASTGVLINSASSIEGNGIRISGLTYGIHTVILTKTAGTGQLYAEALDVIPLINSQRALMPVSFQNSAPVGSQSISDNRNTTPVKPQDLPAKFSAQALGVNGSTNTTSTSEVPLPDMTLTVPVIRAGWYEAFYSINLANPSGASVFTRLQVDGTFISAAQEHGTTSGVGVFNDVYSTLVYLTPGVHKFGVFWFVNSGTATAQSNLRLLKVKEA